MLGADRCHQRSLYKVPHGYCGIDGVGVACPVGLAFGEAQTCGKSGIPT